MNVPEKLPENAFKELKEGEEYEPLMSPKSSYPEVTPWSVTWGILMAVIFSAAAAYLGLKVGQVFEAAIPIAIIAVGVSTASKRKNALGENCNYTEYWCLLGSCGCRSHFSPSCYLYSTGKISRNKCFVLKNIHCITLGWCTWHLIPHSFPQILCERHAW